MNKSGRIGALTESAVVRFFNDNGYPLVERRQLRGIDDAADLINFPGFLVEVKGGKAAEDASDQQVETWLDRLAEKLRRHGVQHGVLITKRRGIGYPSADRFWAIWRVQLINGEVTYRTTLADFLRLYKHGEFGDHTPQLLESGAA